MGAIVDPCVLDRLKDRTVALWFHEQDGLKFSKGLWVVDGGSTAVTRAPFLADMLGFKDITIFGADCSVAQHSRYCYGRKYKEDSVAPLITVMVNGEGPRDRKSTRLNSSHVSLSRMPSSA